MTQGIFQVSTSPVASLRVAAKMQALLHSEEVLQASHIVKTWYRFSGPVSNQRNLIPCQRLDLPATDLKDLEKPLVIQASAIAVPHPEKVHGGIGKAVNKKNTGWGGEDAYFYTIGQ